MANQGQDSGFVLVDKPSGLTSHDVVARIRRLAGTRKVGHAGTLDPLATGLLVIGVNRATRLLGHLSGADKEYIAEICFGVRTHSDDADGEVVAVEDASGVSATDVEAAMAVFRGEIKQVPSSVSAIKIDGRRAHERVRAGEEVVLPARTVRINAFDLMDFEPGQRAMATVRVSCSAGTYVRSLARDVGAALAVGGHVVSLRRVRSGVSHIEQARTLDELSEQFSLTPMRELVAEAFETMTLTENEAQAVRFGKPLPDRSFARDQPGAVFTAEGEFLALYENRNGGIAAVAVFV